MEQRWRFAAGSILVFATVWIVCQPSMASGKPNAAAPRLLHRYRARVPLGSEIFTYAANGHSKVFYVIASALDGSFEGQAIWQEGALHVLKDASGVAVEKYPRQVRFRVSVCEQDALLRMDAPLPIETRSGTFDEFITGLKFEVHIFHALGNQTVRPTQVTHIGVPPDVPYNERIYEATFDLGEVPIGDHIVMHVLADNGERLAKFNLDLF
jgi:hypothetical protein